ncbi:MAG: flippase [Candidatus Kerfeldbacteria bacterium]|nr:flippase [Candidatus Kerfeldbacteria bacterium]
MSLTARIARNTFVQVIGKASAVLFAAVSIGVLTRYLGTTGYGEYTTILAFVEFFGILADLGLYIIAVKKISETKDDSGEIFNNIFTLRVVSAIFFVGLAPLLVLFFPYPHVVKVGVALVTVSNLFVTLNQLLAGLFQRHLAMGRVALAEVVGKTGFLALIIVAAAQRWSIYPILGASVLGGTVQFFVLLVLARKFVRIRLRYNGILWAQILKESWPIAISIALNLIYFRADTIILSLFHPAATVGLYGASYKVLTVLIGFPAMFAGLVLPLLTQHYAATDMERFRSVLQKAFDFLAMVALPMVGGIFVLAHPIMTLIAGNEFAASGSILRVLIFATGSIFLGNLFGNTVVAVGRQRKMIWVYCCVAAGSLIGYLATIPRFGVWGASGMTVATELAITVGSFLVVRRATHIGLSLRLPLKSLAAALVMSLALLLLRQAGLPVAIVAGVLVYGATLLLVKGINREMIRSVLRMT